MINRDVNSMKFIKMQKIALVTMFACGASTASAADWSDTSLAIAYGSKFAEPFKGNDISKSIYSLKHVSGDKYGQNFFNVDVLQSNSKDPGAGTTGGAQEAYVLYRRLFDLEKITGKSFAYGLVKGTGITVGFDWNTKNDFYGSRKRMLVAGPTWMMDVTQGFFDISLLALQESNDPNNPARNTSFSIGRYSYKTHGALSMVWGLATGVSNLNLEGYADFIAPKGKNEDGGDTKAETHIYATLMYDVSAPLGSAKNTFKLGVGYEYWKNKFGNDATGPVGSGALAKTPFMKAEYHF